jgi:glycosyltransferase involved in cell wall biosynthesis
MNFDLTPEVSVILCTYNRENYLKDCIDSVLKQSFANWELIVVDDGSQDNTFEIVNEYLQKYSNIRYTKHKNRKPGYSRNVGIQASFGKYITFLDSDDSYDPNHLFSRVEYMKNNLAIDLIQGGFFLEEDIFVADYFQPGKTINIRECVLGPTFFGKRNVFTELGGYNDVLYFDDTEFWSRAVQVFKTSSITEPQTYIYTRGETSITKTAIENLIK